MTIAGHATSSKQSPDVVPISVTLHNEAGDQSWEEAGIRGGSLTHPYQIRCAAYTYL